LKAPIKRLAALIAAVGAIAAFPGVASAASCNYDGSGTAPDPSLVDSAHFSWDVEQYYASVEDGYDTATGQNDAFDGFAYLYASLDGNTYKYYSNPDINGCTTEEQGREIVFPDDTTSTPGIAIGRRVYVPATGLAFARHVDSFTNTTDSTKTVTYQFGGELGSDGYTNVATSSSGDAVMTAADSWVVTHDYSAGTTDPPVAMVWDGTSQPALRASLAGQWAVGYKEHQETPTNDELGAEYSVTLAPGETKRFMHISALGRDTDAAVAAANAVAAEPAALFIGLSDAEIDTIQNWTFDGDRDGVRSDRDNCPADANGGQENIDGDAKGDVCDDDIDGDGLGNGVEDALRTDSHKADTDGDGKNDNVDSCPTIAAATDEGCPLPVVIPEVDKTAPLASLVVAKKVSLKKLLRKGIVVTVGANEPAAFELEIAAAAKSARLAQVGDLIVSAKQIAIGGGQRSVKLTIAKKFRKGLRAKSRLRLKVVATDAAGNRTVTASGIKLAR
jgi:hypothetical protein